jgi:hypothetical protein
VKLSSNIYFKECRCTGVVEMKSICCNSSLVVGLDNDRGFFSGFGVSMLYSCVIDCVILFSLCQFFPTCSIAASIHERNFWAYSRMQKKLQVIGYQCLKFLPHVHTTLVRELRYSSLFIFFIFVIINI